jgi:hypothetical protein
VEHAFAGLEKEERARPSDQPPRPIQSTTKPVEKAEQQPRTEKGEKGQKLEKGGNPPRAEKDENAKNAQARTPTGQFAPREPAPGEGEGQGEGAAAQDLPAAAPKTSAFPEAPRRFSEDARAAWNDAPEPVRAEIHRATRELEQGLQKYRGDAEAFADIREFDDLAKQSGTTLKEAMRNYVGIEQKLRQDFIGGLDMLCRNRGITLYGLAERLLQRPPNEQQARQDQLVSGLMQKIAALEQQIGGVSKTIETQRSDATMSEVQAFAEHVGSDRFEELAPDIAFFISSGRANDLEEAYRLAGQINPGSSPAPAPPAAASPETPAAQTRKGTLAIHGAPNSGSDPATRKPPATARAAVEQAFARLGLS